MCAVNKKFVRTQFKTHKEGTRLSLSFLKDPKLCESECNILRLHYSVLKNPIHWAWVRGCTLEIQRPDLARKMWFLWHAQCFLNSEFSCQHLKVQISSSSWKMGRNIRHQQATFPHGSNRVRLQHTRSAFCYSPCLILFAH